METTTPEIDNTLKSCQDELARLKEQYTYLMADFENSRKREMVDGFTRVRRAEGAVLLEVLTIVDNFERALADVAQQSEIKSKLAGFELIYKSLLQLLERQGVAPIVVTSGQPLDPQYHEALMYVPHESLASGHIVGVLQKGYVHKGTLLRPAQVSVAQ